MVNNGQDPNTLIALIFRIVDTPRRTLALAALVTLFLAAVSLARLPLGELAQCGTLLGGSACIAGVSWLRERTTRSARSSACSSCCPKHCDAAPRTHRERSSHRGIRGVAPRADTASHQEADRRSANTMPAYWNPRPSRAKLASGGPGGPGGRPPGKYCGPPGS